MRSLTKNTVAVPIPNSEVIGVTYFARTPEKAEKDLNIIINKYMERQANLQSGSVQLISFYEQNMAKARSVLANAEERLDEWRAKNNTASIKEDLSTKFNIVSNLEKKLQRSQPEVESIKAKIATIEAQLRDHPERLVITEWLVENQVKWAWEHLNEAEGPPKEMTGRYEHTGSPVWWPTEPSNSASNATSPASSNSVTVKPITASGAAPAAWSPIGDVSKMTERSRTGPNCPDGWGSREPALQGP